MERTEVECRVTHSGWALRDFLFFFCRSILSTECTALSQAVGEMQDFKRFKRLALEYLAFYSAVQSGRNCLCCCHPTVLVAQGGKCKLREH